MKVRKFFLFAVVIMSFVMVAAFQGQAFCAPIEIDFEQSQGYSAGNLYGQPSIGTSWGGDNTDRIQVVSGGVEDGQCLQVINYCNPYKSNYLQIDSVPNDFMWKFYWKSNVGYEDRYSEIWLGGSSTSDFGPSLKFSGSNHLYYNDGSDWLKLTTGNNLGGHNNWVPIVVLGHLDTLLFDIYRIDKDVNDNDIWILLGSDLEFQDSPTELSYVGLGGRTLYGGDTQCHYYDAVHIGVVPIPGAMWLLGSGLLGLVAIRRRKGNE